MPSPNDKPCDYDLKSMKSPYLSGAALKLVVALLESPLRKLLTGKLLKDAGIQSLREINIDEAPTPNPLHFTGRFAAKGGSVPVEQHPDQKNASAKGFRFSGVFDYCEAYRQGRVTPTQVGENVLNAIEASNAAAPPLRAIIAVNRDDVLKQAEEAGRRIRDGEALSVFDGVPVAVKDELDMLPYPTTVGTIFLGKKPALEDASVVARLRAAGALLIGKANMHEIGLGVTGLNPHHGTARNPYNPAHYTGGSSSGPAAAVAAGLCPVAIGADGGGSIRIPSAFCGLVGLKATFGRISEYGAAPLCWSVAHIGPLAVNAVDAALTYGLIAGPDPNDPASLHQPDPELTGWNQLDLSDLRLGVYPQWFEHADSELVVTCQKMLTEFENLGAKIEEIAIPELESGRVAHIISIVGEMSQAQKQHYESNRRAYGLDVRLNMALARQLTARDYVQAQRIRTRCIAHFKHAFEKVDVILTPASAVPAPAIPAKALPDGDLDPQLSAEIMRFAPPANFTGFPAISFPAGYTAAGLPIGMQAMGRAWQEKILLRLAFAAENFVERKKPQIFYDILNPARQSRTVANVKREM